MGKRQGALSRGPKSRFATEIYDQATRDRRDLFSYSGPEVESRKKQSEDIDNAYTSGPR